ncbi:MAG TPA: arginine--tRNA ligase [Candidatus Saccharimonadales bacterium]|nr:arginine--tRNA ligase [Candidatus Saccharimonadales bacterium]
MQSAIKEALEEAVKAQFDVETTVELNRPDTQFGDLATNAALVVAKQAGQKPRDVAHKLADALEQVDGVGEVSVAGPGFINIFLTDEALVESITKTPNLSGSPSRGLVYVVETNNPNPFKDLHIGHAYNCIVADTIANLIDQSGAQVHRVGYHGDVGLHVGKSMWAILKEIDHDPARLDSIKPAERPKFMSDCYQKGALAYEEDGSAKAEIEELSKESFNPEGDFKTVYDICKAWSFDYIDATLERLGSKPAEKHYLESAANDMGEKTVRAHIGDVFSESSGAVVFAGEAYGLHTRVFIASRGTTLYEARDLGLMQLKQTDFHPAKSLIVTGNEQKEYFKVVFKAAELALPELAGVTENISTGTVKLSTGKMSSRTGQVLNIEWLFDELRNALVERGGSVDDDATLVGALRYQMLKTSIGNDLVFDIEKALSLDGNSGPYLQYAHARAASILRKTDQDVIRPSDESFDASERQLVVKLSQFEEALAKACADLTPHTICNYLYELAKEFNRFYEVSRIVGDEREPLRLWLVERYKNTLSAGLKTLGISAPDKL